MGDMADFALEQVQEMEALREQYNSGDMDLLDAYNLGLVDELGCEITGEY